MSYIEQVARDALQAAYTDLAKARRTLLPIAGVLALIHLLTVYPYLEASREIAAIETTMAANTGLLAALEPEIAKLQEASASAEAQLTTLLKGVTAEMVGSFAGLRSLVASALEGRTQDAALPPEPAASSPIQQMPMQQMPMQQMPMQMQAPPEPMQMQMQVPPPEQMQMQMQVPQANLPLDPAAYPPPGSAGPFVASPELQDILAALAAGEPAWDRLIAYARRDIVEAAYARAERDWSRHIRPAYLSALEASTASARRVAGQAPESAAQTAAALYAAADAMAEQRAVLETIQISHDQVVDEALGLVLSFMLWRVGQARQQGAQAAADLGRAASEDREVRTWLTRRVLGGGD